MKATAPYPELYAAVHPLLEGYHADLTEHDRKLITENPQLPFLHSTRKYGTVLLPLRPADHPTFPPDGEEIPYLFGRADRWHILNQTNDVARYETNEGRLLYQHWDGTTLRPVSAERFLQIAEDHVRRVRNEWLGISTPAAA